jgi:inner membrane protein
MDSVTQFVLGSAVAAVTIGPVIGPRRAMIVGGVLGTLPDLDVLVSHADPIDAYIGHRGPSHAFFMHTLAAPVLGELLILLDRRLRDFRFRTWLAVWLVLVTHALIDAMTTYGTRLFWPFSNEPVGAASIFIIDPLYTLPLLVAAIYAIFAGRWTRFSARLFGFAIVWSTLYMGWTLAGQQLAASQASATFENAGEQVVLSETQPLPFNTLAWRTIAITVEGEVLTVYSSLLDPAPTDRIFRLPQGLDLIDRMPDRFTVSKVAEFTHGFFYVHERDGVVYVSDLRMGLHPDYVFTFEIGRRDGPAVIAVDPVRQPVNRRLEDARWIWDRLLDPKAELPH